MDGKSGVPTIILPRVRDLGDGFSVMRVLPHIDRRMVGPFVFLDQMGPTAFRAGTGLDVRPHPHIGLATVTYLLQGKIFHRDSLGTALAIEPGAVNWMTAGRGIVHSERSPAGERTGGKPLFGIQSWVGLPKAMEEREPSFAHHEAADLPQFSEGGVEGRVIAGHFRGIRAPVETLMDTLYVDVTLPPRSSLSVPLEHEERAAYLLQGTISIEGTHFEAGRLLLFEPKRHITIEAECPARLLLLGGEPMDGPRHLWWNFVSSSKERIEAAKADWQARRFPSVPGETEFIPLPS